MLERLKLDVEGVRNLHNRVHNLHSNVSQDCRLRVDREVKDWNLRNYIDMPGKHSRNSRRNQALYKTPTHIKHTLHEQLKPAHVKNLV